MRDDEVSYADAARILRTTPIEAMGWLQLFRMMGAQTVVPASVIKAAATKMGVAPNEDPAPASASQSGSRTPEQIVASIRADPNQRRRFLRSLLQRMARRGHWDPSAERVSSLRRGFGDLEAGWVRPAIEELERIGWLVEPSRVHRERGDPLLSLSGDERTAIMEFIQTGSSDDATITEWVGG
jgi:hypothetical protein